MKKLLLILISSTILAFSQYADLPTNVKIKDLPVKINANFAATRFLFDVKAWGAKGDERKVSDGAITASSSTLT